MRGRLIGDLCGRDHSIVQHRSAADRGPRCSHRPVRFIIGLLLGVVLTAPPAEGQQAGRVYRVGLLASVPAPNPLAQPLAALGWVEGQNLVFERRYDEGRRDRLPALAAELVERNVSLILAQGTPAARAAKGATATIPIVIIFVADPVGSGLVTSLARPGANITGLAFFGPDVVKKQLEVLKDVTPRTTSVGTLFDPLNTAQLDQLAHDVPAAAKTLALKAHPLKVDASIPLNTVFARGAPTAGRRPLRVPTWQSRSRARGRQPRDQIPVTHHDSVPIVRGTRGADVIRPKRG